MTNSPKFLKLSADLEAALHPGSFILLDTSKGCHTFLILMRMPVNSKRLKVDTTIDLNNDPAFRQYYVTDVDDMVVGSLFRVRAKFCQHTALSVSRVLIDGNHHDMRCLTGSAGGGVYMFSDGNGSCMALSEYAAYPTSSLVIRDKL